MIRMAPKIYELILTPNATGNGAKKARPQSKDISNEEKSQPNKVPSIMCT